MLDIYHVTSPLDGLVRNIPSGVLDALVYCNPCDYGKRIKEEISIRAERFAQLAQHSLAHGGYLIFKSENEIYLEELTHFLETSGMFCPPKSRVVAPTTMYDVFWQGYYSQTGQSLVFQKL